MSTKILEFLHPTLNFAIQRTDKILKVPHPLQKALLLVGFVLDAFCRRLDQRWLFLMINCLWHTILSFCPPNELTVCSQGRVKLKWLIPFLSFSCLFDQPIESENKSHVTCVLSLDWLNQIGHFSQFRLCPPEVVLLFAIVPILILWRPLRYNVELIKMSWSSRPSMLSFLHQLEAPNLAKKTEKFQVFLKIRSFPSFSSASTGKNFSFWEQLSTFSIFYRIGIFLLVKYYNETV